MHLEDVKRYMPSVVVNKLEAAKQVLSKRGEKVMKEMEPHFEYMVPYESPKVTDSLNKWQDYVTKQSKNPSFSLHTGIISMCCVCVHMVYMYLQAFKVCFHMNEIIFYTKA